ncbi:hypothetical protein [Borreliella garinii]|uniref:Uncharacterized protein n=1 Tax=Borreliella garinii PBr TaxID=498743 RepID=B8F143_BORGR|nr:hypothetical protein [Borreliella garinii]ACL34604.1 hypothetical protein BGAPBR_I0064 [Borreliella garinii PBr]
MGKKYIDLRNKPKLKENVKVVEIESDLDKLKPNFEKIKENIVNSDDEYNCLITL